MMDAALRAFVLGRAGRRCEYGRLHEDDAGRLSFQVEHIIARQHGGTDDPDGLCFACAQCNWAKGPNLAGIVTVLVLKINDPARVMLRENLLFEGKSPPGE